MMMEIWLYPQGDDACIAELTPVDYSFQVGSRSGGIAFAVKNCFTECTSFKYFSFDSVEAIKLHLVSDSLSVSVVYLYRKINSLPAYFLMNATTQFHSPCILALAMILWSLVTSISIMTIPPTVWSRLKAVLQDHDFKQIADVPTHRRGGHILD